MFNKVASITYDMLAAPASEVYVECIFSVFGLISSDKINPLADLSRQGYKWWMIVNSGPVTETHFV